MTMAAAGLIVQSGFSQGRGGASPPRAGGGASTGGTGPSTGTTDTGYVTHYQHSDQSE